MSLITLNETSVELSLSFKQIKLIKLEKIKERFTQETIHLASSKVQNRLVLKVESAENEIIIIVLEINEKVSDLVFTNDVGDIEVKQQLNTLKTLFGGESELTLTESSLEETNDVFNNFGKGLSALMSINPKTIQPIALKKNEKLSWQINKRVIDGS